MGRQVSERGRSCWRGIGFGSGRSIPTAGRALFSRCNATQQRRMHGAGSFSVLLLGKSLFSYGAGSFLVTPPTPRKSRFSTCFYGAGSFPVLPLEKSRFSTCFHGAGSFPLCLSSSESLGSPPVFMVPVLFLSSPSKSLCSLPASMVPDLFLFVCPPPRKASVLHLFSWCRIFSCPPPRKGSSVFSSCLLPRSL